MTTHHFGTDVDPSHYVEIPDTANPGQVKRPPAGIVLKVRAAPTLADLPDVITTTYGYWETTTTDVPQIYVSGDNWATAVGPLTSAEASTAGVNAGTNASAALAGVSNLTPQVSTAVADAAYARTRADYAVSQAGSSGFTGTVDWTSQVQNKPAIPSLANITLPVNQSGTTYPTPPNSYGRWWLTGTADPTAQGLAPRNGDRWTKVKLT